MCQLSRVLAKKKNRVNGVGCLDVSKTKLKVGPLITISKKEMKPKEQNTWMVVVWSIFDPKYVLLMIFIKCDCSLKLIGSIKITVLG